MAQFRNLFAPDVYLLGRNVDTAKNNADLLDGNVNTVENNAEIVLCI